jgi:UDP-N-acetylglucosamine--N-acetylmuramyl-(pentapeptide) pyrophosphoryl-undecaprenol N-acetylglucosamine transferase
VKVFFAGGGTGGHLYPALAIARALVREDARVEPFFVGARRGVERDVLPTTEFPFELLELHPLYRQRPWLNWRTAHGGVSAWRRISALVEQHRPVALVATGGYAAGVALAVASARRIPIVLQEQNSFAGLTVRWFARKAAQIHLGFPEAGASLRIGPSTQVFASGNPIEPPPPPGERPSRDAAAATWGFETGSRTTILVTGASQGAEAINRVVAEWIREGGTEETGTRVIWTTGPANYERYAMLDGPAVKVRPYIAPMRDALAAADVAIARAGAMTSAELAAWGIPALFVPLPTAAADHQTANARAIAAAGAGVLVPQADFTVDQLRAVLSQLLGNRSVLDGMHQRALERARPNAAQDIARHILDMRCFK